MRKALLIGGLDGLETRNDTELVAGLEVRNDIFDIWCWLDVSRLFFWFSMDIDNWYFVFICYWNLLLKLDAGGDFLQF